jgi:hypothetical protein
MWLSLTLLCALVRPVRADAPATDGLKPGDVLNQERIDNPQGLSYRNFIITVTPADLRRPRLLRDRLEALFAPAGRSGLSPASMCAAPMAGDMA